MNSTELSGQICVCGDAEQIEGLTLKLSELRRKGLDGLVVAQQRVTFRQAEQAQDLLGGGTLAEALLRVNRY